MSRPTVSVIIPCYDDADVVARAAASATDLPVDSEAIIVDNTGDPDVVALDDCDGVRVVPAPPQPAGHNRNVGLDAASGEYVQFCDADDRLLAAGLAPRIDALEQTGAAVAVGRTKRVPRAGDAVVEPLGDPGECPAERYLRGQFTPTIGGVLCRRDVFETHRFDESLSRAQDFALWTRVFFDEVVVAVDEPAFTYYQHADQRSRQAIHERYSAVRQACLDIARQVRPLRRAALYRWRLTWVAEVTKYRQEAGLPSLSGALARLAGGEPA